MAITLLLDSQPAARTPVFTTRRDLKMSEMGTPPSATPYIDNVYPRAHQDSQHALPVSPPFTSQPPNPTRQPSTTSVRRRISKACDRCNQLRTKCDGLSPCKHCVDNNLRCEYVRERKKRGKVSKKDLARVAATSGAGDACPEQSSQSGYRPPTTSPSAETTSETGLHSSYVEPSRSIEPFGSLTFTYANKANHDVQSVHGTEHGVLFGNDYRNGLRDYRPAALAEGCTFNYLGWDERMYGLASPAVQSNTHSTGLAMSGDGSAMHIDSSAHTNHTPRSDPNSFPSFATSQQCGAHRTSNPLDLKYPVLGPLLPYIRNVIPLPLACDLLEHYFSTTSPSFPHPRSPYIIAFMFGKRAFLRLHNPRVCSPALLASMLWIAARTSDAKYLSASPASRGRVCQKLVELAIKLLRPLVHRPAQPGGAATSGAADDISGTAVNDLEEPVDHEGVERSANGTLDDVATYIHLGVVVSASEYKGASLRWWNAAWGLARELKLGRELPPDSTHSVRNTNHEFSEDGQPITRLVSEEEREERRRIWWLLFCIDRHLGLCYNKPICLPDRECETLLQPMDELSWQTSDFDQVFSTEYTRAQARQHRGPPVVFTGPSLFGYFLPLMAILGEIIDLNHARTHPRFGSAFVSAGLWDEQARIINLRLENYVESVQAYQAQHCNDSLYCATPSSMGQSSFHGSQGSFSSMAERSQQPRLPYEALMQQKKAISYATHIMHVLHILLTGRWDPIALLDDDDMWIYSQSFVSATSHAVSAAEAAGEILELDPEVSFMPFLYGIYLLQGSFLLLLMADKLQREAAPNVIRACETIVRAHEACAVTLNTEYQRNFRKVMRSALSQVKGHAPPDEYGEEQARRREVLSLYRWTGDGTGLNTE